MWDSVSDCLLKSFFFFFLHDVGKRVFKGDVSSLLGFSFLHSVWWSSLCLRGGEKLRQRTEFNWSARLFVWFNRFHQLFLQKADAQSRTRTSWTRWCFFSIFPPTSKYRYDIKDEAAAALAAVLRTVRVRNNPQRRDGESENSQSRKDHLVLMGPHVV